MTIVLRDLWWRRITANDLFNIDKPLSPGPKGQEHVDVPNVAALQKFLGDSTTASATSWRPHTISAKVLVDPSKESTVTFQPRPKNLRYHIRRQNINSASSERHRAWTSTYGWPATAKPITSTKQAKKLTDQGLVIFFAHDANGDLFAGFFRGKRQLAALPPELISIRGTRSAGFIETISPESSSDLIKMLEVGISKKSTSATQKATERTKPTKTPARTTLQPKLDEAFIGNVDGTIPGQTFADRTSLSNSGIHGIDAHDIWYIENGPAVSIIAGANNLREEDQIQHFIYTVETSTPIEKAKKSTLKSTETPSNRAILYSRENEVPVRLIRSLTDKGGSTNRYIYEGLFEITSHWFEKSSPGNKSLRVELTRLRETPVEPKATKTLKSPPKGESKPERRRTSASVLKRDYKVSEWVKSLYDYSCQICSVRLVAPNGPFAQGAHIKAIGGSHAGEDVIGNMLCLCPNCHALFDYGACYIGNDGMTVMYLNGVSPTTLKIHQDHGIDLESIEYHRIHIADVATDTRPRS